MSPDVVINGRTLLEPLNGIPRYVNEILLELDKISGDGIKIELVMPSGKNFRAEYENIKVRELPKIITGSIWDLRAEAYARKNNALYINMENRSSFYRNSIIAFHDIRLFKCHTEKKTFKARLRLLKFWLYFKLAMKRAKKIVTVSNFTKNEITSYAKCSSEKIHVFGSGWEHIRRLKPDYSIFEDFPEIKDKEYYLSIGSIAPHKNFDWIVENAKYNKEKLFVIIGRVIKRIWGNQENQLKNFSGNIIYTGFQSDERIKALILHAKALIFPSFYEGFGLPPLEALALGTPAIVSDIPVMHEIFSDSVKYIDPHDAKIELDNINAVIDQDKVKSVLEAHTWKKSALNWRELIRQQTGK